MADTLPDELIFIAKNSDNEAADAIRASLEMHGELARLRVSHGDLLSALKTLTAWTEPFIANTSISAETLWREFPKAREKAVAAIAKAGELSP